MSVEERLENVEKILLHKYGTLNLETIKERDERFFKEANAKLENINAGLDEMEKMQLKNDKAMDELKESRRKIEEIKKQLGFDKHE